MDYIFPIHKEHVRIMHLGTGAYLTDTGIVQKNGTLLGAQQDATDATVWILEKYQPFIPGMIQSDFTNSEIWPGDLIVIRSAKSMNVITRYYIIIISNANTNSQVTKQGEVLLQNWYDNAGEQVFVIQTGVRDYNFIRIYNNLDGISLHSHASVYKKTTIQEVTGFKNRDDNDFFRIFRINASPSENMVPRVYRYVHHQDRVIIRNADTGGVLQSHDVKYSHGNKSQEVAWRKNSKRDDSVWWQILLQSDNPEIQNSITDKAYVGFYHILTKQKLTHLKDARVKNKDFLELTCGPGQYNEFQIEGVDCGIPNLTKLSIEYPFRIRHVPTNQYVCTLFRSSSKTTTLGELVLQPKPQVMQAGQYWNSVWMIEHIDSIFD